MNAADPVPRTQPYSKRSRLDEASDSASASTVIGARNAAWSSVSARKGQKPRAGM